MLQLIVQILVTTVEEQKLQTSRKMSPFRRILFIKKIYNKYKNFRFVDGLFTMVLRVPSQKEIFCGDDKTVII